MEGEFLADSKSVAAVSRSTRYLERGAGDARHVVVEQKYQLVLLDENGREKKVIDESEGYIALVTEIGTK